MPLYHGWMYWSGFCRSGAGNCPSVVSGLTSNSEKTLSPHSHRPSPLAALPHYGALNDIVSALEDGLPADMSLLKVIKEIRDQTWDSLKGIMFQ